MAVPKKKKSKSRTKKQFRTWVFKKGSKMKDALKLVKCPSCGAVMKAHNVCRACGIYKGKQIIKKASKAVATTKKVTAAKV
jgi:large subunit ribosomal protein L32